MAITLELPPALEQQLVAEAEAVHRPLADYIVLLLKNRRVMLPGSHPEEPESYPVGVLIFNPPRDETAPDLWAEARAALGPNPPSTPAEIVAYWEREGLIGTRPDLDGVDVPQYARELRRRAERRERD